MGRLLIFIDESGTMPLEKENNIFVAAGIGTFGNYPNFEEKKGYKSWLVSEIKKHTAIPFVSFINPTEEYKKKIKSQFDKIELMAQVTLHTTGRNKKYISPEGLERRNIIWIHTVNNCIGNVILNATVLQSIDELYIYIDQKTLKPTSLNLLLNQIERKIINMHNSLEKMMLENPNFISFIKSRLNWNKNTIKVQWSNEPESSKAVKGLELAHYLSYHFNKDFKKNNKNNSIQNYLTKAGYGYISCETTDLLLREINEDSIKDWEKNTRLKRPY